MGWSKVQKLVDSDAAEPTLMEIPNAREIPLHCLHNALESLIQLLAVQALIDDLDLPNFDRRVAPYKDPKLLPETWMADEPVVGVFDVFVDTVTYGSRNIHGMLMLPLWDSVDNCTMKEIPECWFPAGNLDTTLVLDNQNDTNCEVPPSENLGKVRLSPNWKPKTLTLTSPVHGDWTRSTEETRGSEYVKNMLLLPIWPPTEMTIDMLVPVPVARVQLNPWKSWTVTTFMHSLLPM